MPQLARGLRICECGNGFGCVRVSAAGTTEDCCVAALRNSHKTVTQGSHFGILMAVTVSALMEGVATHREGGRYNHGDTIVDLNCLIGLGNYGLTCPIVIYICWWRR